MESLVRVSIVLLEVCLILMFLFYNCWKFSKLIIECKDCIGEILVVSLGFYRKDYVRINNCNFNYFYFDIVWCNFVFLN